MHVLFEGVLSLEVRLMLKHFILEKFFTLDTLNSRIKNFAYGRKEAMNKPPKSFSSGHITGKGKLPLSGIVPHMHALYMHVCSSVAIYYAFPQLPKCGHL